MGYFLFVHGQFHIPNLTGSCLVRECCLDIPYLREFYLPPDLLDWIGGMCVYYIMVEAITFGGRYTVENLEDNLLGECGMGKV